MGVLASGVRLAIMVAVIILAACGSGEIDRDDARSQIQESIEKVGSGEHQCVMLVYSGSDASGLGRSLQQLGYITDFQTSGGLRPLTLTEKGRAHVDAGLWTVTNGVLSVPMFQRQVEEITGISTQETTALVEYTFWYSKKPPYVDALKEAGVNFEMDGMKVCPQEQQTGRATFRKFDTGWRLEKATR